MASFDGGSAGAGAASGAMAGSAFGPYGTIIGGLGGGLVGGFAGGAAKSKEEQERRKQQRAQEEALARLKALQAPEYKEVKYGRMGQQEDMRSGMADLNIDQDLRNKQLAQMNALNDLANRGGLTTQDTANFNNFQMQAANADKGRRDAINQQARMSGMASGGNSLLAQLQSSQAASNQASQAGSQLSGMAQNRALDAIQRQGDIAGNVRGMDWQQKAQKAMAMDEISKFNTTNRMNTEKFNIEMDAKEQDMYNQLKAQSFNDQFKIASQIAAQLGQDAQFAQQMAMASAAERGALIDGMLKTGVGVYSASQDKKK